MQIVITGAASHVGRNIIPYLLARAQTLVLAGDDTAELEANYPTIKSCKISEIKKNGADFDCLINLQGSASNDHLETAERFQEEITKTTRVVEACREAGIRKFYNISSTHVLDLNNHSLYAEVQRENISYLKEISDISITNVYRPYVIGDEWYGRMKMIENVPQITRKFFTYVLSAFKPTITSESLSNYLMDGFEGSENVVLSDGQQGNIIYNIFKKAVDLLFATVTISCLWWLLLAVWIGVKLESKGPGIFKQNRVGKNGKIFVCYKFRTMREGTQQVGTHELSKASVTRIGRFLRSTKIDELPQVWNVLRNEISLIGPRPGLPNQNELYKERNALNVYSVKPGITGLAQVNNVDMSDPKLIAKLDSQYIALQSIVADSQIIWKTISGNGQGDKTND